MMEDYPGVAHLITVGHLKALLAQLHEDDVLFPNQVANLMIEREGQYIGFINLLDGNQAIELFEEEP